MSARLIPLTPGSAPVIVVHRPVMLVGRHPECDVRINTPKLSRRHCCVALAYDRVVIRDLGSRNGLRLNGAVIDEARLVDGDEVAIGHLIYRVEDPESAPQPTPPPEPEPEPTPTPPVDDVGGQDSIGLVPLNF